MYPLGPVTGEDSIAAHDIGAPQGHARDTDPSLEEERKVCLLLQASTGFFLKKDPFYNLQTVHCFGLD